MISVMIFTILPKNKHLTMNTKALFISIAGGGIMSFFLNVLAGIMITVGSYYLIKFIDNKIKELKDKNKK